MKKNSRRPAPKAGQRPKRAHRRQRAARPALLPVVYLSEPRLAFAHSQAVEDPRDGLTLFGPLDAAQPTGFRVGVIGTARGLELYRAWARRIQSKLVDSGSPVARPHFLGFSTVFRAPWSPEPALPVQVPEHEINATVALDDQHQRVYRTVSIFADRIAKAIQDEDSRVDLWFVIIPDIVHTNCRPKSRVPARDRIQATNKLNPRLGRRLLVEPSLFAEDNLDAVPYQFDVDFHHQLKARLLGRAPTQIVREGTLLLPEDDSAPLKRDMRPFQASVAWNLCTAAYYKAGGRPWKLHDIRGGVCYVGMVFKRTADSAFACCAAQMFLSSGDGVVFRGAVGPWYSEETREYHLDKASARELINMVVQSYAKSHSGVPPKEVFLHGRTFFNDEEWSGFVEGVDAKHTTLVGIRIRDEATLRFYRYGRRPALRGMAVILHEKTAYLFTKGFTPRLKTYVGREVPRPLRIDIARGSGDIKTVLADVLALTKLNYNTCLLGDGMPVTLRFANAVGEILTAAPAVGGAPLAFKHYI